MWPKYFVFTFDLPPKVKPDVPIVFVIILFYMLSMYTQVLKFISSKIFSMTFILKSNLKCLPFIVYHFLQLNSISDDGQLT